MRAIRERERQERAYERALKEQNREEKRFYVEGRAAEVDAMNAELNAKVASLENLLAASLLRDAFLDFEALKEKPTLPPFDSVPLDTPGREPSPSDFYPRPLSAFGRLFPGAKEKQEAAVREAAGRFDGAMVAYRKEEGLRQQALARAREEYEGVIAQIIERAELRNRVLDELQVRFEKNEPEAIVWYYSLVLDASPYPEGFSKQHRVAFVPESRQLVVEQELPTVSIVPSVKAHRYVKVRDAIEDTARPQTQTRTLYARVVAQAALRTLHELFEADRGNRLETVVLNCYVDTTDPSTGRPTRPHLVTVRASEETFRRLDLRQVDPLACLRGLNAGVSRSPHELLPVRPILEFDMVDPRFIQESDVLTALDQRPNLMELTPKEFESLISNLFEKMGLETRQTQASRDGGVDCVAYDPRPIFGGKVIIQAKRYKNTVGVSAVRDLFGTMQNEGASKGILVTTSGYGKSSFEFADNKPLELLSGSNLLYLLAEHAGIEARIEPPEDWVDPMSDLVSDEPTFSPLPASPAVGQPEA